MLIISIVDKFNSGYTNYISTGNELIGKISVKIGLTQGDSLRPLLSNLVMDKIIRYKMINKNNNIVCYIDDDVLLANSEDILQRSFTNSSFGILQYIISQKN